MTNLFNQPHADALHQKPGRAVSTALILLALLLLPAPARAGVKGEAVEAVVRHVMKQFDKEVVEELGQGGWAVLARRTEALAAKYGEREALEAVQKVGPRVFRLVDNAGAESGGDALRLLARSGDEAAWVVSRPQSMALVARHGDEAADAMIKHKEIAESVIAAHGKPAARALRAVDGQSARRLAMMDDAGELSRIGRTDQLLDTVARHGDGAMNFVWKHKGALATAAVLTAFLNNPQPFIDGTVDVAQVAGDTLVKPLAQSVGTGVAGRTDWTKVIGLGVVVLALLAAWRMLLKRRGKA